MNRYTYRYTEPGLPPFKTRIRFTRGRYIETTEPTGTFGLRYAVFANRSSEVWIPLHDLTPETKTAIAAIEGRGDDLLRMQASI